MNDARPGRGRPRDADTDRAILDATVDELSRCGYQGMSVDGVALRANVSKPTIYRRWSSKPTLAIAAIAQLVAREVPTVGEPVDDLVAQLWSVHQNLERSMSVSLLGTLLAERDRHPEFLETYRRQLLIPRRDALQEILDAARERGEVANDTQTETCAGLMLGHLFSMYMQGHPVTKPNIRTAVLIVWRGINSAGHEPES